ncbi:flagellar motor protein MotB [Candidatus Acidulodesulfobacterium sp. H_13]|uniref:flagellar motor protein MotB n=1 Tax=Candidatus Acidulodesulfobacterium sp. H_13 TaxID=3395470 RepID=UPI003AF5D436
MRRKKKPPEGSNKERWMISYGDFLTTLLSFFIVMFAISKVNNVRLKELAVSIQQAFGANKFITVSTSRPNIASTPSLVVAHVAPSQFKVSKSNKTLIKEEKYEAIVFSNIEKQIKSFAFGNSAYKSSFIIYKSTRGLIISLKGSSFFRSGSARILKKYYPLLKYIALELLNVKNNVTIEGYTDSTPIHTIRYPNNWMLSTARAVSVLGFFIKSVNFPPERLSASGYGKYKPVASNKTAAGRALNRRVNIVVLSTFLNNELPRS